MDELFDRFFGGSLSPFDEDRSAMRMWDFGVMEDDKEIVVRAEMPGFDENEIDVQLRDDVLTIKAEKEQKGDGQQEYRSFYRALALPQGVDAEKVRATYRNGLLELHIPRPEGSRAKRIAIQGHQAGKPQGQAQQAAKGTANGGSAARQSEQAAGKAKK
jgi:HSP20 family protein